MLIGVLAVTTLFAKDHPAPAGVAPAEALKLLQDGNGRFVAGKVTQCAQPPSKRAELASGQHPHTIVLTCSDSRVPPELVFDQGLGELFTVRVAGNVLESSTRATIEYAIEHLGARLILVMGHDSCGAVKAALDTPPKETAGSPDLDRLVAIIRSHLKPGDRTVASADPTNEKPARENVDGVSLELLTQSKIVKAAVDSGRVKLSKGIYHLGTGKVEVW